MFFVLDYSKHEFVAGSVSDAALAYKLALEQQAETDASGDEIEILFSGDGTDFRRYSLQEFYDAWISESKPDEPKFSAIGTLEVDGTIDVTDPCYNHGTWCRINDVPMVPGKYTCCVWESRLPGFDEGDWGVRVSKIGIFLEGTPIDQELTSSYVSLGDIGVDSGLAGFFRSPKPDYTDEEWEALCKSTYNRHGINAWIRPEGFFSSSGYGDGGYGCYGRMASGTKCDALVVEFIVPENEEE